MFHGRDFTTLLAKPWVVRSLTRPEKWDARAAGVSVRPNSYIIHWDHLCFQKSIPVGSSCHLVLNHRWNSAMLLTLGPSCLIKLEHFKPWSVWAMIVNQLDLAISRHIHQYPGALSSMQKLNQLQVSSTSAHFSTNINLAPSSVTRQPCYASKKGPPQAVSMRWSPCGVSMPSA